MLFWIKLIGGAIVALAILGAIHAFDLSRQNIGAAKQIAKYAPVIEQCKAMANEDPAKCAVAIRTIITNNQTCEAANKSLGLQIDTIIATHNTAIEFEHQEYEKAKARKAQATATNAPKLADLAMEKFNLITSATKGQGMTCAEFDDAALKEAQRKIKFYGPATPAEPPKGGLRIVEPPPPTPQPTRPPAVNPLRPKP